MKISTKGRYALRMMLDIAVHQGEGYVALKDTAQREEISKKYLEQIALQLTQAGLLRAVRGHQGGYRLLKAGCRLHYNAEAVNYHWHPVPYEEQCQKMFLAGKSTVRFYKKHRDLKIPLIMGMNPLSLGVHALMPKGGWLYRALERWAAGGSKLGRDILLQHHYVSGIRSVWPA